MNINISEAIREAKIMIEPVAHEEALQQAKIFVSTSRLPILGRCSNAA